MIFGFRKAKKTVVAPKLRARSQPRSSENISGETAESLVLGWPILTARASYFELKLFTQLSNAVEFAPDLVNAEGVTLAASHALRAHHDLAAEIIRSGEDPVYQMQQCQHELDQFFARINTTVWLELVLSSYLVSGIFGDFLLRVADVADERNDTLRAALRTREESPVLREIVFQALEMDPKMSDRMALWGRRLVGDVILICRDSFPELLDEHGLADPRLQAVLTEIIASHTRRMDSLGLTA